MPIDPTPYSRSEYLGAVQQQPSYIKNTDRQYRDNYLKAAGDYWDANQASKVRGRLSQLGGPTIGGLEGGGPVTKIPGKTILGGGTPPSTPSSQGDGGGLGGMLGDFGRGVVSGFPMFKGGGPNEGRDPSKMGWPEALSKGWPMVNTDDPNSVAVFMAISALGPIAKAYGFGPFAEVAEKEPGFMGQIAKPTGRFLGRTAISGGVGAGVGAAVPGQGSTEDRATKGGLQGLFGQAIGETAEAGITWAGNKMMSSTLGQRLAAQITRHFPELDPVLKKEGDFNRVFAPREKDGDGNVVNLAQKIIRRKLDQVNAKARELLTGHQFEFSFKSPLEKETAGYTPNKPPPGTTIPEQAPRPMRPATPPKTTKMTFDPIRVPKGEKGAGRILKQGSTRMVTSPGKPEVPAFPGKPESQIMDFDQYNRLLYDSHDLGWDMNNKGYSKNGAPAMMRGLTTRAEDTFAAQMDEKVPGLGNVWLNATRASRGIDVISQMMKEDGVLRGSRLGVPELQTVATDLNDKGYYHDIIGNFGDDDGHKMLTVIMNGADPSTQPSIRGQINPYIRARFIGPLPVPYVSARPVLPFTAGATPEGNAMLSLLTNVGAQGVFRMLVEASGGDDPYQGPGPIPARIR